MLRFSVDIINSFADNGSLVPRLPSPIKILAFLAFLSEEKPISNFEKACIFYQNICVQDCLNLEISQFLPCRGFKIQF